MPDQLFDEALIKRYDVAAPRYTSYPTAPQFQPVEVRRYADWAEASNAQPGSNPLSLYVHIPFCSTVCYYCACNKIITRNRKHAAPYLENLFQEIGMQAALFTPGRPVRQLHWGGGTPTFLDREQMRRLMQALQSGFELDADVESSIELDPREVSTDDMGFLKDLGFNRVSLGVQDIDPRVQRAVNRIQPFDKTSKILEAARDHRFNSISVDLIYGLPKQTPDSFEATLDAIIRISPDRLSVFNYAHLPARFKVQRQIDPADLPSNAEKLETLGMTIDRLCGAGYVYIGMDHFARPDDELAAAQRNGTLHRNFQGYSTHADCDLVGLGVSSIGQISGNYAQNHHRVEDYRQAIDGGGLAVGRGIELSQDDRIRRSVIGELICHFELDTARIERDYWIEFGDYFEKEIELLRPMTDDGLVEVERGTIRVRPAGRLLIRNICAVFDAYYNVQHKTAIFSKAI